MNIAAIPTMYGGVQFRSRLEARWAAFFDLLGWEWEYEPIDLNGYIPDFVLMFHEPVIVEVKPFMTVADAAQFKAKIEESVWENEALLVGSVLLQSTITNGPAIGLLNSASVQQFDEDAPPEVTPFWDTATFFGCLKCGRISFRHDSGSWSCRVCGAYDGNRHVGGAPNVVATWREAGNTVQWRASA